MKPSVNNTRKEDETVGYIDNDNENEDGVHTIGKQWSESIVTEAIFSKDVRQIWPRERSFPTAFY